MPSIDEMVRAARLSGLKAKRILDGAAKDVRQGRIVVPRHIPGTHEERLKWAFFARLVEMLGKDAFDRAILRAFDARNAA